MSYLFSPLQIRDIRLKNRIAVSPMCQYSAEDGFANNWHLVHLGSRAAGGAALVITEAAAVCPEGRISPADLGLWKDEHIAFLQQITGFVLQQGAVPGIQLAHAGRKASVTAPWLGNKLVPEQEGGWQVLAPSAIAFSPDYGQPRAMTTAEITQVIEYFKQAAHRALEAGFRVVELHAAHGYLLHQFLSPLSNQRTDEWGGSFANRTRLLVEVVKAVRSVWPLQYPLFVRISATDWADGGWNPGESVQLAALLQQHEVDLMDCSSGGLVPHVKIPVAPLYQVPFAEKIKKETGLLTGAVGLITRAAEAESIIAEERADLVLLARQMLRDPYFPLHAAQELGEHDMPWPVQYLRAKK